MSIYWLQSIYKLHVWCVFNMWQCLLLLCYSICIDYTLKDDLFIMVVGLWLNMNYILDFQVVCLLVPWLPASRWSWILCRRLHLILIGLLLHLPRLMPPAQILILIPQIHIIYDLLNLTLFTISNAASKAFKSILMDLLGGIFKFHQKWFKEAYKRKKIIKSVEIFYKGSVWKIFTLLSCFWRLP